MAGYFEEYVNGRASGWAINEADLSEGADLYVLIDNKVVGYVTCSKYRQDVETALGYENGPKGFEYYVPFEFRDGRLHRISFLHPSGERLPLANGEGFHLFFTERTPGRIKDLPHAAEFSAGRKPAWYRLPSQGDEIHEAEGQNIYFDETWYLDAYPEVRFFVDEGTYLSGYDHYCSAGYLTHNPHWLFDGEFYLNDNPDITPEFLKEAGFINGYDHYLSLGQNEGRRPHVHFDESIYRRSLSREEDKNAREAGYFTCYLTGLSAGGEDVKISLYFDPWWYRSRYPLVSEYLKQKRWCSSLHHYLTNATPTLFNPLAAFDERYYLERYPDVSNVVTAGSYRNGYAHFLRYGASEERCPAPSVDLRAIDQRQLERAVTNGMYRDAFEFFLDSPPGVSQNDVAPARALDETDTRELYAQKARYLASVVGRHSLDFSYNGKPEVSVIVVLHNQFHLTLKALTSLRSSTRANLQLILIDSGSTDETATIAAFVTGAYVRRFERNVGYVEGCNAGLDLVEAPAVLFLNNDVTVWFGAVDFALKRLFSTQEIGAVGAKIIRTNGSLQEAGGIIWRDGTTTGYLRDAQPDDPRANFVRDVDYCSAAFLMVRHDIVKSLGGFDLAYRPAYFEDADLCVRLVQAGYRVIYDPSVVIEHYEFGSSSFKKAEERMKRSHSIFRSKHRDWLQRKFPRSGKAAVLARNNRTATASILFIDDRIPLRGLGSGYVRSNDLVNTMSRLGYQVTIYPIFEHAQTQLEVAASFDSWVEVMTGCSLDGLDQFLTERPQGFDLIWLCRTHNLSRILPIIHAHPHIAQTSSLIFDSEAIAETRNVQRSMIIDGERKSDLGELVRHELAGCIYADNIVAVSEREATLIRYAGYDNVVTLGHMIEPRPTGAAWQARKNILFVGSLHDETSPNYDSLIWFIEHILPIIQRSNPSIRLSVVGYVSPGVNVSRLRECPAVDFHGFQRDLSRFYETHRVFVAPTRFSAGIPYKIHEAASFGLPCIVSEPLSNQLGWRDRDEIMVGSSTDADNFAGRVVELYETPDLWNRIRTGALARIERHHSIRDYEGKLNAVLTALLTRTRSRNNGSRDKGKHAPAE